MRLLVVEDEKKLAVSLERGLEADGFAVDVALDGTDGKWMATEHDYDAIVLDIMVPGINGFKLCGELREAGNWTPILMLTAKDGELDEAEALDTGADDFLRKPFSHVVLVARLRALLRRGQPSSRSTSVTSARRSMFHSAPTRFRPCVAPVTDSSAPAREVPPIRPRPHHRRRRRHRRDHARTRRLAPRHRAAIVPDRLCRPEPRLRALDIESLLDSGTSPRTVAVESDEDGFVQILDATGGVIASSENIDGEGPIAVGPPESTRTKRVPNLDEAQFRVRNHLTDTAPQTTIVVGINLEDVDATGGFVRRALLIGLPLLLLTMAVMIWFVVGRALHPVEAIRREVARIGARDLDRRVPVPVAHDEIGRLANTMNSMLGRLEDANIRQARFVSDASHELRTPIAVIPHELEIALRGDGSDWRDVAADVLDEDLRMQRLVDDLLLLARQDASVTPLDLASVPLVDLDDVVLTEAHSVRSIKVVRTSGVSAGQVRGDADQLGRVVRNLVDNALHHAVSTVEIHLDTAAGDVQLTVDDDGDGVDDGDRTRIFERFGRADESRTRSAGGSGLGLAIVTELVAGHSGTIDVTKSPQLGGARFIVTLPDARS